MLSKTNLLLAVPPTEMMAAQGFGLTLAHMAYRVGGGPHLFRANLPVPVRGGVMLIDDAGFDGRGDPAPFCQEVVRECAARGYTGVICDFDRHLPLLGQVIAGLSPLLAKRGWPLYVPEPYGRYSATAKVLIPTALSRRLPPGAASGGRPAVRRGTGSPGGGAVRRGLFSPLPQWTGHPPHPGRAPTAHPGAGTRHLFLQRAVRSLLHLYDRQNGAHFILFDDAASIRKKLHTARSLDIADALLLYPEVSDLLTEILR